MNTTNVYHLKNCSTRIYKWSSYSILKVEDFVNITCQLLLLLKTKTVDIISIKINKKYKHKSNIPNYG